VGEDGFDLGGVFFSRFVGVGKDYDLAACKRGPICFAWAAASARRRDCGKADGFGGLDNLLALSDENDAIVGDLPEKRSLACGGSGGPSRPGAVNLAERLVGFIFVAGDGAVASVKV